jgi:fructokinase
VRPVNEDRPIVVTGEALIDLVLTSDGDLRGHPGGGPYNVARTIARLAQPVVYLGRISRDPLGDRLRRQLACDGVDLSGVVATEALTTLAMAQVDRAGVARYRFYARETSAPGLTVEEARAALPRRVDTFYLGTLGLVLEPLATTLETVLSDVDDGTLVALDPNCRPATIADAAGYRGRLARLLSRADVIKVSEEDLAWLVPGVAPVGAARGLLVGTEAIALVTLGGAGACVLTRRDALAVRAPAVRVVDTIGAGDAFMGAFLARWRARGLGREGLTHLDEVADAVGFACQVAALTCTRPGADAPDLRELEEDDRKAADATSRPASRV